MLTRRTEAFRQAAEMLERICADEGLELDAATIDATLRIRVAPVAAELGVTDRTALDYAPPETIAVNLARTLKIADQLNQAEAAQANKTAAVTGPSRFGRDALVHTTAPADTVCARCDEPIAAGEPTVSVPGLYRRGLAHQTCVPGPTEAGLDGDVDA